MSSGARIYSEPYRSILGFGAMEHTGTWLHEPGDIICWGYFWEINNQQREFFGKRDTGG